MTGDLKLKLLAILLLCLNSKLIFAQQSMKSVKTNAAYITGFAHNFKDSTWLYLQELTNLGIGKERAADSTMIINERFYLTDKSPSSEELKYYIIRTKSYSDYKFIWIEAQPITISGVKGNFRKALVNGSVAQQVTEDFERITMPLVMEIDSLRRYFGYTDSTMLMKTINLEVGLKQLSANFIKRNATSVISVYLLSVYCKTWGLKTSKDLYDKLSQENKKTEFGIAVKKFIDLNKEIDIGSSFVDFRQLTAEGKAIRLSSLTGKYILLVFWASWCGPCRKENPNLVATYDQYKSRGFEIFGVSLDKSSPDWKKAITADKLSWLHVSDIRAEIMKPHSYTESMKYPPIFSLIQREKLLQRI